MINGLGVLVVVPARGGSKGMLLKNLRKVNGIDNMADSLWQAYLENSKQSDNIYMELRVVDND